MITLTSARFSLLQMTAALGVLSRKRRVESSTREEAGFYQSRWSKLLHGKLLLTLTDAEAIAELHGATRQERLELSELVNDCWTDHTQPRGVLHRGTSRLLVKSRREAMTLPLTAVGATVIPEALQTARYMLAVNGMTSSPSWDHQAQAEAEANHALLRSDQTSRTFLVAEAAVRTVVGNHEIMAEAVRHMIGLARASVVIRVVPSDAVQQPVAAPANFELYPAQVFVPTATGFLLLDGTNDLAVYSAIMQQQRECALSPEASLARLADIADGYTRAAERSV